MIIDKELTDYSSQDDVFSINLTSFDVYLRYHSWERGMTIERQDSMNWVQEYDDPDIPLLKLYDYYHQIDMDSPVHQYIQKIPVQVREHVSKFDYLQTSLLQCVSRSQRALEMLYESPVLLWIIANHLNGKPYSVKQLACFIT